jgi:hypothetical protein
VSDEQALKDLKSIIMIPPGANYRLIFSVKVDKDAAADPKTQATADVSLRAPRRSRR